MFHDTFCFQALSYTLVTASVLGITTPPPAPYHIPTLSLHILALCTLGEMSQLFPLHQWPSCPQCQPSFDHFYPDLNSSIPILFQTSRLSPGLPCASACHPHLSPHPSETASKTTTFHVESYWKLLCQTIENKSFSKAFFMLKFQSGVSFSCAALLNCF